MRPTLGLRLLLKCDYIKSDNRCNHILHCYAKQVAQLSQRDCAAVWVSYGQKWKTGTGRQYFTNIIDLSLKPLWRNWPAKQSNSVKKNAK